MKISKFQIVKESTFLVLKNPIYFILSMFFSYLFFSVFIFLNNIPLFQPIFELNQMSLVVDIFTNIIDTLISVGGVVPFSATVIASILAGVNLSMIVYKINAIRKIDGKEGLISFVGMFSGALSAACSACSVALIATLGFSGGIALLPLKGLEFSITSIIILLISLYFISKSLVDYGVCKIRVKK